MLFIEIRERKFFDNCSICHGEFLVCAQNLTWISKKRTTELEFNPLPHGPLWPNIHHGPCLNWTLAERTAFGEQRRFWCSQLGQSGPRAVWKLFNGIEPNIRFCFLPICNLCKLCFWDIFTLFANFKNTIYKKNYITLISMLHPSSGLNCSFFFIKLNPCNPADTAVILFFDIFYSKVLMKRCLGFTIFET